MSHETCYTLLVYWNSVNGFWCQKKVGLNIVMYLSKYAWIDRILGRSDVYKLSSLVDLPSFSSQ